MKEYGENLKLTIYGESHSEYIGMTLYGLRGGIFVEDAIRDFLKRRSPRSYFFATERREEDEPIFVSGIDGGVTNGEKIEIKLKNTDVKSEDYEKYKYIPRPSHADYTSFVKYGRIFPGGGVFSGRMTAPLCIAGAICSAALNEHGINVFAHISQIGSVKDISPDGTMCDAAGLIRNAFPVLDENCGERMIKEIERAFENGDSVGGSVECIVTGLGAGYGGELFDGLEGRISSAVFAIPAVKGIEFGSGFRASNLSGSQNNDPFRFENGKVVTLKNDHGGILGGISSGMPIILNVAIKPTPTIKKECLTVDLERKENVGVTFGGRHDPCIVPRAVPCVEAAVAFAIADIFFGDDHDA